MKNIKKRLLAANFSWKSLISAGILSAYAYVFFEWLFIVTKPSFISPAPLLAKIRVGFFAASLLAALCLAALLPLLALSALASRASASHGGKFRRLLLNLGAAVPAGILACLALLLIDNFTYTVFQFGIVTSEGVFRAAYLLLLLGLFIAIYLKLKGSLASQAREENRRPFRRHAYLGLILLVIVSFLLNFERPEVSATNAEARQAGGALPHILLITADGLNASDTSLYDGYERDTTPILRDLSRRSLLAENVFNNAGKTWGSTASILTGKYPTETRVLYSPDILRGEDAYQHLPNILKHLGYYNVQYGHVIHVDGMKQNMLAGFDEANGKTVQVSALQNTLNELFKTDYAYFIYETGNRIIDRLRHITYNKTMENQRDLVSGKRSQMDDNEKLERIFQTLRTSDRPVFVHLHWLGTHGPKFYPAHREYSRDQDVRTQPDWDHNFYDDSIIDFDAGIGRVIDELKKMGVYDNTILIVSTDHSQNFYTTRRIPLLIHFPGDRYEKRITSNVQLVDIAPTVLDYLKVPVPAWMRGLSLLNADPGFRPILAVGVAGETKARMKQAGMAVIENDLPPFFHYGFISVIYCNTWYEMDLDNYRWEKGPVAGYTGSCAGAPGMSDQQVFTLMRSRLAEDGFDTATLANFSSLARSSK